MLLYVTLLFMGFVGSAWTTRAINKGKCDMCPVYRGETLAAGIELRCYNQSTFAVVAYTFAGQDPRVINTAKQTVQKSLQKYFHRNHLTPTGVFATQMKRTSAGLKYHFYQYILPKEVRKAEQHNGVYTETFPNGTCFYVTPIAVSLSKSAQRFKAKLQKRGYAVYPQPYLMFYKNGKEIFFMKKN